MFYSNIKQLLKKIYKTKEKKKKATPPNLKATIYEKK